MEYRVRAVVTLLLPEPPPCCYEALVRGLGRLTLALTVVNAPAYTASGGVSLSRRRDPSRPSQPLETDPPPQRPRLEPHCCPTEVKKCPMTPLQQWLLGEVGRSCEERLECWC